MTAIRQVPSESIRPKVPKEFKILLSHMGGYYFEAPDNFASNDYKTARQASIAARKYNREVIQINQ